MATMDHRDADRRGQRQRELFLRDVLTVLFKRKSLIVIFAVLVFGIVFGLNYVLPPTYESSTRVRIIEGRETISTPAHVMRSEASMVTTKMTVEDVNSEIELLYGEDVLNNVIDALKEGTPPLDIESPSIIAGGPLHAVFRGVRGGLNQVVYLLALKNRPTARQATIEMLRQAIQAKPVEKSFVLDIRVRYGDPGASQQILTTLLDKFQDKHLDVFREEKSQKFIEKQLERVNGELENAQKKLQEFRNDGLILELDVEKELLLDQYAKTKRLLLQLAPLQEAVGGADAKKADASIVATLSRETESTVITEFRLKLLEKVQRQNKLMQSIGPRHPEMIGIINEIKAAKEDLEQALELTTKATEEEKKRLETRLKEINDLIAKNDTLEREVRVKSEAVEYYSQKREEAIVADDSAVNKISSIRTVSDPSLPIDPVSPRKLFNLLVAAIAGIVGGIGLAFFLDYLDHGLKTPEDIAHYLYPTSPLGSFNATKSAGENLSPVEAERVCSIIDMLSTDDRGLQMIEVVSAVRDEGSLRVARALAEASARDPEERVLLIDLVGDGVTEDPGGSGFMQLVTGEIDDLGMVATSMGNLDVIGRGSREDFPHYMWRSDAMTSRFETLKGRYDRIVVHVRPVGFSHDAQEVAGLADGTVMVIRADSTRREVVERAIETLAKAGVNLLGAVLTERKHVIPMVVYKRI